MPAIITHDFFGRDVYDALFQTIGGSRDEADAFLLGNQGPDPLFYAVADFRSTAFHKLGNTMHSRKPAELLAALKDSLGVLDPEEKPLGRAYALGFLATTRSIPPCTRWCTATSMRYATQASRA